MKTLARESDKAALLVRLRALTPSHRRRWGRMTVHEMVCHVGDALRMMEGDVRAGAQRDPLGPTLVKWIALYAPLPWPPGIRSVVEVEAGRGGTPPGVFADDLARAVALIDAVPLVPPRERPPHPIFGPLSNAAWMRWAWLHTDHHLRQFGG